MGNWSSGSWISLQCLNGFATYLYLIRLLIVGLNLRILFLWATGLVEPGSHYNAWKFCHISLLIYITKLRISWYMLNLEKRKMHFTYFLCVIALSIKSSVLKLPPFQPMIACILIIMLEYYGRPCCLALKSKTSTKITLSWSYSKTLTCNDLSSRKDILINLLDSKRKIELQTTNLIFQILLPKLGRGMRKIHIHEYYGGLNRGSLGSTPKAWVNSTNTLFVVLLESN